jgi:hypothetical protein
MVLYEEWFAHPNHYNPVTLTSYALRRFNISRHQKSRALSVLEKSDVIYVYREKRKNPLVTLTWLPLKNPKLCL